MKKIISIALIFVLCFSISAFAAKEKPDTPKQLNITTEDMVLESRVSNSTTRSTNETITETYSAIVVIDKDGNATVQNNAIIPRLSATGSNENTYWKANISITYEYNSSRSGKLTYASGSWVQLHGSATLSGRSVTYYQNFTSSTVYPSSNTFSYATGFATTSINTLGATSSVNVSTAAATTTLTASVKI